MTLPSLCCAPESFANAPRSATRGTFCHVQPEGKTFTRSNNRELSHLSTAACVQTLHARGTRGRALLHGSRRSVAALKRNASLQPGESSASRLPRPRRSAHAPSHRPALAFAGGSSHGDVPTLDVGPVCHPRGGARHRCPRADTHPLRSCREISPARASARVSSFPSLLLRVPHSLSFSQRSETGSFIKQ